MAENYTNIKVEKKEKSQVEISGEINADVLMKHRSKALKNIGENVNIPGFRKGHIPEKVLVDNVGEHYILEEAAELAIQEVVLEIVEKNAPNYIGRPHISITKLAPNNPLGFKVIISVVPEIKLPDYATIAKAHMNHPPAGGQEKLEVTDKEIENVIEEVRKQRAHVEFHRINKEEGHSHTDEDLDKFKPEFNDEFVKTIGNFTNVDDFKTKAKENLLKEKEHRAVEKRRIALLEKLVEKTSVEVPPVLIDNELNRMFAQFEQDVAGIGLKVEDYLKHIKKTPEDLRKDWLPDAEKRAKLNLILEEIAKKENIKADPEAVKHEVEHLSKHYKDIDLARAELYVDHNLRIEKVIQWLEGQK